MDTADEVCWHQAGVGFLEAQAGIEPTWTDLQSAA